MHVREYRGFVVNIDAVEVIGKPVMYTYTLSSKRGKVLWESPTLFSSAKQAHRAARRYILKRVKLKGDYKW